MFRDLYISRYRRPTFAILSLLLAAWLAAQDQTAREAVNGTNVISAAAPGALNGVNLQTAKQPGPPVGPGETLTANGIVSGYSEKNDESPPLRNLPPLPSKLGARSTDRDNAPSNNTPGFVSDGAVQSAFSPEGVAAPLIPGVTTSFEGIVAQLDPPDTNGEIGPNHYVQIVNVTFQIFNKAGTSLYGPAAIHTLWTGFGGPCETRDDGDPVVLYDQLADRWVISQFSWPNGAYATPTYECVAVSKTGDPTGAYFRYSFSFPVVDDYPKLGMWPDGYYMSYDSGSPSIGPGAAVFDRSQMLIGQRGSYQRTASGVPGGGYFVMLPTDLDGFALPPSGEPNFYMGLQQNATTSFPMWKFHVDWSNVNNSSFAGLVNIPVASFNGRINNMPQYGTSQLLSSQASRAMFRLSYRNFGAHESLVFNHTVDSSNTLHGAVRWYEVRAPNTSGAFALQAGTYAPDGTTTHRWMGSLAMDRLGDMGLGYSVTSNSVVVYPGIRYTGRLAGDPLNTMPQGEGNIITGGGVKLPSSNRWGDYSDMTVDPTDDCTFWYTTEYMPSNRTYPNSRIASFKFPQCTALSCGSGSDYVVSSSTDAIVSGSSLVAGSQCDDCVVNIPLPFTTKFYGSSFNLVSASSNGNLQFNSAISASTNTCLPYSSFNNAILGYWDNLDMRSTTGSGLGIYTLVTGLSGSRIFHIEWRSCVYAAGACGGSVSFEIRLYENLDYFEVVYGSVYQGGRSATVGVQKSTGTSQTQFECRTTSLSPGLKLVYRPRNCQCDTSNFDYVVSPSQNLTTLSNFQDIGNHCDDCYTNVSLPFTFDFYGIPWSGTAVTSNGTMQFFSNNAEFTNSNLPYQSFGWSVLPYWDDLRTDCSGCGIFTSLTGTSPNRTFGILWNAQTLSGAVPVQFAVVLHEGRRNFDVQYTVVANGGSSATVGVQSAAGSQYTLIEYNTAGSLAAGTSYTFTPPCEPPQLSGHVVWQGRPPQPDPLQSLPVTITLKSADTLWNSHGVRTDERGLFTVPTINLTSGQYQWRIKGHKYLANGGTTTVDRSTFKFVDWGTMLAGDANDDDVVDNEDLVILNRAYGGSATAPESAGEHQYDERADFNDDGVVDRTDRQLLMSNFGKHGAPPLDAMK